MSGSEVCYWFNQSNGHSCVDHNCSSDAFPIVGCFTGKEDFLQIRWIGMRQECALDYDDYKSPSLVPTTCGLSTDDRVRIITQKRDQKPEFPVGRVYPGVALLDVPKAVDRLKENDSDGRVSQERLFLPSITPGQFNFSGVFLTNNAFQGVLHSFLRHSDKWREFQPQVDVAMDKMKSVKTYLDNIRSAFYMSNARSHIDTFLTHMRSLPSHEFSEIQGALNEIQIVLVKTLQEKLQYNNYRGEGTNEKGQYQTYFQMKDDLVAVIGYSRELFVPEEIFDKRPFRTIITIYFINDAECHKRTVMKSF